MRWHVDIDSFDNRDPDLIARFFRTAYPYLVRYFRAEVRGVEDIAPGPALYVGNHSGGLATPDSFVFAGAVYATQGLRDVPFGLAHEWVIGLPGVRDLYTRLGAVRASHENALRGFAAGHKMLVYPGGDLDDMRPFRHRHRIVFGGRRGYVRLALRAGVPIIPVVGCGSHSTLIIVDDLRWLARLLGVDRRLRVKVWPISLTIPWGLTVLPPGLFIPAPAKLLMEVLPPIRFEGGAEAAEDEAYVARCADVVEAQMQATLTRLATERRQRRRALVDKLGSHASRAARRLSTRLRAAFALDTSRPPA